MLMPYSKRFGLLGSLGVGVILGGVVVGCQSPPSALQGAADNQGESGVQGDRLDVTVTIPPQQYFVEKIGGDRLNVNVFVPGTSDPHTYEPKPQQLQALSETEAYILVGLGFENPWLDRLKSANADMVLIDSSQGIDPLLMDTHDHGDHGHGHGDHGHGDHSHADDSKTQSSPGADKQPSTTDPHIWLSPTLVKQQATTIAASLSQLDPPNAEYYQANLKKFLTEIDQLDDQIQQNLTSVNPRKFIVFHPSWGYFAKDYNLEQIPIEVEGQEPSAKELGQLVDLAKNNRLQVIFSEPQFSPKNAEAIATEIQGRIETINPLAANWSENLINVSQKIREQGTASGG
ncbi:MAG: Zinc transporter, periplasmic-binding protein ZnuA [Cyanobacteriota bacterium]|jgi:zinc transport system substrate-binding protein